MPTTHTFTLPAHRHHATCGALALAALAVWSPAAMALDAACEAGLKASETRLAQPQWHSVTQISSSMTLEAIKHGGRFYSKINGAWSAMDIDVDEAEKSLIAQIRTGSIRMSQCRMVGADTVDGTPVQVVAYRIEMPGAPAADTQLFIGKTDGLPYRQVAGQTAVRYRYQGVTAPKP